MLSDGAMVISYTMAFEKQDSFRKHMVAFQKLPFEDGRDASAFLHLLMLEMSDTILSKQE